MGLYEVPLSMSVLGFGMRAMLANFHMCGIMLVLRPHLSEGCYRPTLQAQSSSSSHTTSRDAKPTQHIEMTHSHNVNSKLSFHKVASFHIHYSTYTLQTYHHQEHQFRSWPTQMTSPSHLHTQARVQPRNTYNYTYITFLHGQNKTILQ